MIKKILFVVATVVTAYLTGCTNGIMYDIMEKDTFAMDNGCIVEVDYHDTEVDTKEKTITYSADVYMDGQKVYWIPKKTIDTDNMRIKFRLDTNVEGCYYDVVIAYDFEHDYSAYESTCSITLDDSEYKQMLQDKQDEYMQGIVDSYTNWLDGLEF